jgi:hypothetical protein
MIRYRENKHQSQFGTGFINHTNYKTSHHGFTCRMWQVVLIKSGTLCNTIIIRIHPPTNKRMKRRRMQFTLFAKVISTTSEPWHKDSQERF